MATEDRLLVVRIHNAACCVWREWSTVHSKWKCRYPDAPDNNCTQKENDDPTLRFPPNCPLELWDESRYDFPVAEFQLVQPKV